MSCTLWLAQRHCGLTQAELGEKMGGMDYAAVSAGVRRYEKGLTNVRKLKKKFERAQRLLNVET